MEKLDDYTLDKKIEMWNSNVFMGWTEEQVFTKEELEEIERRRKEGFDKILTTRRKLND